MKLHFIGHNYRYAMEQMMLSLFPGEKPGAGDSEAALTLTDGGGAVTGTAVLRHHGKICHGSDAAPAPTGDALERDRVCQRVLKNAFYEAAVQALGREWPWGSLTGVRPVKLPTKAMEAGATEAEAEEMLRTLYRVSPPRRALAMDCARASLAAKQRLRPGDISLYVGIPFCPTRCAYCSFVSSAVGKTLSLTGPYVDALCREIAAAGRAVAAGGKRIRSAYMGGGTPTTLSAEELDRLLTAMEAAFDLSHCGEFTVEAGRPDTITPEKLGVLRAHGIGRISVNPQSLRDEVLAAIGRAHSAADIRRAWAQVREAGFPSVNMDLIAGLPADTAQGFRFSLDGVLALRPENITVHTLALKKGSRLLTDGSALPPPEAVAQMLDYAWDALRGAGYVPYYLYRQKYMSGAFENVGWCLPGGESLYNIAMMEELHTILSLGSGGITKLINPAAGSLTRICNPKYPKEYLDNIAHIETEKEALVWPIN